MFFRNLNTRYQHVLMYGVVAIVSGDVKTEGGRFGFAERGQQWRRWEERRSAHIISKLSCVVVLEGVRYIDKGEVQWRQ